MYKYTEKFVADLLFNNNSIRIGTLDGFKKMEATKGISDPLEGSYIDTLNIDYFDQNDVFSNPILRENLQGAYSFGENASIIMIVDPIIINTRTSPNYLIFCSAHKKSSDLLEHFEGADTCYHIHKPSSFYQLITWELEKELNCVVKFLGVHKVVYDNYERNRSGINSRHLPPSLAKTLEFQPQCELRAIWEIPEEKITKPHYDLKILGLRKFCKIVDL